MRILCAFLIFCLKTITFQLELSVAKWNGYDLSWHVLD